MTYRATAPGTYPPHLDWAAGESRLSTDCGTLPLPLPPWLVIVTDEATTTDTAPPAPDAAPVAAEE